MKSQRHRIQFPQFGAHNLAQDEAYFYVLGMDGDKTRIRFHDYDEIYRIPGLYEQVFYDRLKCSSPEKVTEILKAAVDQARENFTGLRVLDLGAGNGLMGEALKDYGVSRMVGVDIIPEAQAAVERDRPHLYDAYYIADFCNLSADEKEEFRSWSLDCLTTVAALGFGDIPPKAFMEAFNLIRPEGWVAFNIKETFLRESDSTGFSRMIRDLIFSEYLEIYHLERYRHRLSMEGEPLYYFAIAGRKKADIPEAFFGKYADGG
ncbi:MAG: methyltransferase domain-containing protein [Gammaproteobacteria bacterium]|jgi:SAM-dependent methyltransferase|nr:methyltransferase domain-containing protein [Gammaproteobacteria bacterium]